jgi:hypothetical protein
LCLNAVLCFSLHCIKKHPLKLIKSVLSDYYDAEAIAAAKDKLMMDIDALLLSTWKCPAKRRGENKSKQEIEDILSAITFVDENLSLMKLPRYVVDNLDEIPIMRMERGELAILISKLDKIDNGITNMQISTLHTHQMTQMQSSSSQDNVGAAGITNRTGILREYQGIETGAEYAHQDKTTTNSVRYMDTEDPNTTDLSGTDNASDNWTMANRKKRRLSQRLSPTVGSEARRLPNDQILWSARVAAPSNGLTQSTKVNRPMMAPKKLKIIGKANPAMDNVQNERKLKSAKPYVKKAIFAVYNVDSSESVASISEFIEQSCGVKPVSCFPVKSRDTESLAFRVCIDENIRDKFLDPELWPNGIVIRPWSFKPKEVREVSLSQQDGGV